jgi:MFS family permease
MRSAIGSSLLSSYFIGTICAGWFGFGVLNWDSDWSWRLLNLLQAAGSVWMVVLILLRKMVESPRWLVKVGRIQEAHTVLAKLHANGKMDDELVLNELNEMKEVQSAADQTSHVGLKAFWATTGAKKRLFVVIVAAAGTQLSGSVLISAYLGYVDPVPTS